MKKLIIALAIFGLVTAASAQSLDTFKTAVKGFSSDMAGALALNASVGSNWSDAYIGGFPHFGVGIAGGATFTGEGSAEPLFEALGQATPSGLEKAGIPIPAAALTFKIGMPVLPIDLGLTGGIIPPSVGESLGDSASVDYQSIGAQVRVALLKEKLLLPDVSFGFGVNYQKGGATAKMGAGDREIVNQEIGSDTWTVTATDPDLMLDWEAMTYDATLQLSKRFLFIRPYAGLGYSFGKATVEGGVSSDLVVKQEGTVRTPADLAAAIEGAGGTAPDISSTGFSYTSEATDPVFRLYGGLSFHFFIALDAQVVYVPSTKAVGGSLAARIQL